MRAVVQLASHRNIGAVYVTDDSLPNPWDTLPPWWSAEANAIATTPVAGVAPGLTSAGTLRASTGLGGPTRFWFAASLHPRVLELFDVAGRQLRSLPVAAGEQKQQWDGRDQQGLAIPASIYFARLRTTRESVGLATRFARLR